MQRALRKHIHKNTSEVIKVLALADQSKLAVRGMLCVLPHTWRMLRLSCWTNIHSDDPNNIKC